MTDYRNRTASRIRVPVRAGETIAIINSHDDEVRRSTATLAKAFSVDLGQFSDNMEAGLPTFMPVKPHRSGLFDNDNNPACE